MLKIASKKEKVKTTLINIKVTPEEREALLEQAKLYTNGNLSLWIRYAALNLKPPAKDLLPKARKKAR